jgi:hypothetical protein
MPAVTHSESYLSCQIWANFIHDNNWSRIELQLASDEAADLEMRESNGDENSVSAHGLLLAKYLR